ncbi:MAG TPA: methyltransferase domain-containing protein [Pyrinomonadaceae bacterium]|jgi:demethylmenaquinone methyltransferase/2-methoxy-6-polyprenyl-1,4-benzoquinol methylase|nr:methyltransferase domain-containing protein [Pyrinomonadaceae bacterium]
MERMAKWVDYDAPFVRRRYNRLARFFVFFEWLFLLPRGIRRQAVSRMELKPGSRVLEVGCGTGRNLAPLVEAVGPEGRVYGVDLSEGMLAEAGELCARAGWRNVTLMRADAAGCSLPEPVDGVIFSLSYAVIPDHRAALRQAWRQLRAGGYLVIMDAKLPSGLVGKLLHPAVVLTSRLTVLGNPDVRPWDELKELTADVDYEETQFGTYYICRGRKGQEA